MPPSARICPNVLNVSRPGELAVWNRQNLRICPAVLPQLIQSPSADDNRHVLVDNPVRHPLYDLLVLASDQTIEFYKGNTREMLGFQLRGVSYGSCQTLDG
ncbi:hypothetical protein ACJZ2D_013958 [Fusarium nematophilum]